MKKASVVIFFILAVIRAGASGCSSEKTAQACKKPIQDVKDLIKCRFTASFPHHALDNIITQTGELICKGLSADEIGKKMKDIVTRAAMSPAMLATIDVIGRYNNCLKKKKTNLDKALSKVPSVIKKKCPKNKVKELSYSILCPYLTENNGKRVAEAVKEAQGNDVFQCAVQNLDPKLLFIKKYLNK